MPSPDPQTLTTFFNHASSILGDEHISRTPDHGALPSHKNQDAYNDPFSTTSTRVSGALRPNSVAEIQEILRLANTYKIPLWPISRGRNLGYGGASPIIRGTVVLDLHRMNRILEVNGDYGYAIVEPGVSFFDLYEEIQRRGLRLWPSTPAVGWGSVMGNALERGFGYTPEGKHSEAQCGMEVVLPDGEVLRAGSGAVEGNKTFALFKGGFGPSIDGIFFQSNLGVVTKLGIHISPAPEAYAAVEVSVPNESDLIPLVDILSDLQRRSIIVNVPSVANLFRQALTSTDPDVRAKLTPYMKPNSYVPSSILAEIQRDQSWGFWKAYFSLHGSVETLPALQQTVQRMFSTIPETQISFRSFPGTPGGSIRAEELGIYPVPQTGVPTTSPLNVIQTRGAEGAHMDFSPVLPPSGRDLFDWYLLAKQRIQEARFDYFADFYVFPRHVIAIELMIYAVVEDERVRGLMRTMARDARERGYMAYRTHVDFMGEVADTRDFNHHAFGRFVSRLKGTLDPNAILAGGKSGIWNGDGCG